MRPEQYWIDRGTDVIGTDVLHEWDSARQAETYKAIVDLIMAHFAAESVLDAGCNFGVLQMWLRRAAYMWDYVGVDSNPHAVAYGRALHNDVKSGNLYVLDFPDRSIDVVVVKDVIEHLKDFTALGEALRVARRGVIVATYLPWVDGPGKIRKQPEGYYTNVYSKVMVKAFALGCGWTLTETIDTRETNGTPNAVYVWERLP